MKDLEIQLELIKEIELDINIKKYIIDKVHKMIDNEKKDNEVYYLNYNNKQLIGFVDGYDIDKEEKLIEQFCKMID